MLLLRVSRFRRARRPKSQMPWISGITQIGIRGTGSARSEEVEAARDYGARIFTAHDLRAEGLAPVLGHLSGRGPFYLTVDADGFDPSVTPAVLGRCQVASISDSFQRVAAHSRERSTTFVCL